MAPSRGRKVAGEPSPSKSSLASRRWPQRPVPKPKNAQNVYNDMLAEAALTEPQEIDVNRPLKKRKVKSRPSSGSARNSGPLSAPSASSVRQSNGQSQDIDNSHPRPVQKIELSEESEIEDDEDGFEFEDVNLEHAETPGPASAESDNEIADVSVSVEPDSTLKRQVSAKRKPASSAEKAHRVLVHKAHMLCLLGHCMYLNGWCTNAVVQSHLRPLLPQRTVSYLNPNPSFSQFQRDRSFMDGLHQASEVFHGLYRINASGMKKAQWLTEGSDEIARADTDPIDRSLFITAAKKLEGSQDTGNQLFCALLRSVGVAARLVCSLQTLPFSGAPKSPKPQKFVKHTVSALAFDTDPSPSDASLDETKIAPSKTIGKVPSVRKRLGQPSFTDKSITAPKLPPKKPVRKLSHPIFWVEAFNSAHQKWIPVDAIVTRTINKPSKFEPPSSYQHNQMTYVIAFEDDGVARDVTKRYAKAFNAKTRRQRIESIENGGPWLKKALRLFRRRGGTLDREQVEDAELAQKEAREGMPGNVQDFKDHPYYALERHLKRHEVIHPRREVGKVNAGTAAKPKLEVIYRRQDVTACKSADKWYRLGREVQKGEQPVKHVPARRKRAVSHAEEDDPAEPDNMTALYAPFQTEQYVPPPVVNGQISRNAYGNLDIYVPSMVPRGGTHIRHHLAQHAAKILKVDYADAVTGFKFKGRHGTAVVDGVVVANSSADAVTAVIEGLQEEQSEEESMARSAVALRMWKRLLTGLRIAERVSAYGDPKAMHEVQNEMNQNEENENAVSEAGGFFPDDAGEDIAMPTAGRYSLDQLSAPSSVRRKGKRKAQENDEDEDEDEDGGGEGREDGDADDEDDQLASDGEVLTRDQHSRRMTRASRRQIVDDESEDDLPDAESKPPAETQEAGLKAVQDDANISREGGGFIPEDTNENDSRAGGFVDRGENAEAIHTYEKSGLAAENTPISPQINANPETTKQGLSETSPSAKDQLVNEEIDALSMRDVIYDEKNAIASDDAAIYPSNLSTSANAFTNPARIEEDMDLLKHKDLETVKSSPREAAEADHDLAGYETDQANRESDDDSMISHDPEDEDAEPDWLQSD